MKSSRERAIGFIGAGNMATAMLRGLIAARLYRPRDVWVTDVVPDKRRALRRRFDVEWAPDNVTLVRSSKIVVFAVKPQTLPEVLSEVAAEVTSSKLFISIAAGFPIVRLAAGLGDRARLVRVMPNTPALLGKGMSVLVRGGRATAGDERTAMRIFRAVGDAVAVRDEALLDPVTGLSGSGPAYVYRFAEALVAAGEAQGLDSAIAERLALRTLDGACAMLRETGSTPKELRDMVSSPGGTTLAGLAVLDAGGFGSLVGRAVAAATERSRELARG